MRDNKHSRCYIISVVHGGTMSCDSTTWIIQHGLVYFGPFFVGLFSGGPIFGKCPKTENT